MRPKTQLKNVGLSKKNFMNVHSRRSRNSKKLKSKFLQMILSGLLITSKSQLSMTKDKVSKISSDHSEIFIKVQLKIFKIEFLIRLWKRSITSGRTKEKIVKTGLSLDTFGTIKIA